MSNDDRILDLIVVYFVLFQTVTRQSPVVGCWKLSLTNSEALLGALCFRTSVLQRERFLFSFINTLTGNLSLANMAKDGLANLGESLEEAFADLNIPFQLNKVQTLSLIAYFSNKLT